MKKIRKYFKKPIVLILIAVILIIAGYFYFSREKKPDYEFVIAARGEIIQEVSVTGSVKPAEAVDLSFENSGKVVNIYADVGDKVTAGELLATIDNTDISAQLVQAEADVRVQQAKLDELRAGTREEEIKVQEIKVQNAETAIEEAEKNLIDKIQDAYTKSDDALRNKIDQTFENPVIPLPQINFSINDSQLESDIEWQRIVIEDLLNAWGKSLAQLTVSSDLSSYLQNAKNNLNQVKSFLDKVALAINKAPTGAGTSQSTLDAWKVDAASARTNVNTAISNVLSAEENLNTAQSNFSLASQELVLKKAGATSEQIQAQEAQVEKARANVLNYRAQLDKTIIRSPINGIVTKQNAKVGEIVAANTNVISVISKVNFEIEANVPEADIAKIKINDKAIITLDAYGNDVEFDVKVVKIDPAETLIEGVATYKTTFQFMEEDERVKSGMTANIDILTDKRENVIIIPQRAVTTKGGERTVNVLTDSGPVETRVKIGLRGSDGNVEITEGINEGDKIITSL